jgi:zinc protease
MGLTGISLPAAFAVNPGLGQDAAPILNYPEFLDTTLANGLRVLVAEHHEQPAVFVQMLVKSGIRDEPAGKEGLAELVAQMLNQGAAGKTAEQIAEAIDRTGGSLWTSDEDAYTLVGGDVLAKDTATGLGLFTDIIRSPDFPKKDLERVKRQMVADIKSSRADPTTLAMTHADYLLYGAGYRLGQEKTERSVRQINQDDLQAFHSHHFLPNNAILLAIGDFKRDEMLAQLSTRFGSWPAGPAPAGSAFAPAPIHGIRARLVDKPDLTQGTIVMLERGLAGHHSDRPAYQLMDYILVGGGLGAARLVNVVRAKEGKTYHVGSLRKHYPEYGAWGVWTFTRSEEVASTAETLQAEIRRFRESGATEDELRKAKSYYSGAVPLRLESPRDIAARVLDGLHGGFTLAELRQELATLSRVTLEDVNRLAQQYLDADSLVLVVVGNAATMRKDLARIGKFEEINWRKPLGRRS